LRVLFDTTALYVAAGVSGIAFTPEVQRLIELPETVRMVSPISFTEIAIKANKGLTPLTREHVEKLIFDLDLTVIPFAGRRVGEPLRDVDEALVRGAAE
jgi:PIN domain nuclease of toxin-antitoxin system